MKRIALIVGHNSKSKGAYSSHLGVSEFDFFKKVAEIISSGSNDVEVFYREECGSYSKEMQAVVDRLNSKSFDLCIELHFNSFNGSANGSEVLCYHKSSSGKKMADEFNRAMGEVGIKTRGLILVESSSDRGGYGIVKCKHPYILIEPFFGDNPDDCSKISSPEKIARIISNAFDIKGSGCKYDIKGELERLKKEIDNIISKIDI